jgi:accessory gene regulator protein AgrB
MTIYTVLVALHAVAAVLGAGLVLAIAVVAHGPTPEPAVPIVGARLLRLLRATAVSMALLLLTGLLVTSLARAFTAMIWFRMSFALFIVLGAIAAVTRRRLARALAAAPAPAAALRTVERAGIAMCAVVAVVAFLMAAKPS